jgi:Lamin Tail Domain
MFKLFVSLAIVAITLILGGDRVEAVSQNVMIHQLQTQGAAGVTSTSSMEYVSLRNDAEDAIDITNWCIVYGSASDVTQTNLKCFTPPNSGIKLYIIAKGYVSIATNEFVNIYPGYVPDGVFSAGIAASAGHIKVLDASKNIVDKIGWGNAASPETIAKSAHAPGKILQRGLDDTDNNASDFTEITLTEILWGGLYEETVPVDTCPNTPELDLIVPVGYMKDADGNCYEDVCDNLSGLQKIVPAGYVKLGYDCEIVQVQLSELLPNIASTDTGKEYIELYNPTPYAVDMAGYSLRLGAKTVQLPSVLLLPLSYIVFSDTETGLTLLNTEATLALLDPEAAVLDSTSYTSPLNDQAWALIGGVWQYTDQPTRAAANVPMSLSQSEGEIVSDTVSASCPAGKYRNPLTGRCKNIETNDVVSCAADQERNPETNRCRSIFAANATLTACKTGQERNPETNRCRSIASVASTTLKPCVAGQERNPETNRCRKIVATPQLSAVKDQDAPQQATGSGWWIAGLSMLGFGGYAAWEWRWEALRFMRKFLPMK